MAQIVYRGNLSTKTFPFISEHFGRSVIVGGPDQNFSRQLTSSEDPDKNIGIPQMYYCHNVMPTSEGVQSIGYVDRLTGTSSGFIDEITLRDTTGNEVFYSHTSSGLNYVLPFGGTEWVLINTIPGTAGVEVTNATINGQSYIYFANIGCYMYDAATNMLVPIVLTGLDPALIEGITSSFGYMIAWSPTSIAWSSTVEHLVPTDPIDFVPSLVTGAGGGNVEAAKGKITLCKEHYLGFIIYTTDNAVASVYSGNARYPFNLRPIVNSGGLASQELISTDSGAGNHYAYTTSGLQLVSVSSTNTIYPELTDFISGEYFEDFNEITNTFITQSLTVSMKKEINLIADRYLVISYGTSQLTHAIVYDLAQKRMGKLKIIHTKCFEWKVLASSVDETPRQSIGFLQFDGSIKTVDFSYDSPTADGVMLLGKYQYIRTRMLMLEHVELENIKAGLVFGIKDLISLNGKTISSVGNLELVENAGTYRKYNCRLSGKNHTLVMTGGFYMSTIILTFNPTAKR